MSAYSQIGCVAGSNYDYDNVWLMRLNSVGDTIKVCRWGGPQNDDLLSIIPAYDGGAIGVGCYNSNSMPPAPIPGNCDLLIIKTDCNLISGLSDIPSEEFSPLIYPNPAASFVNIRMNLKSKDNITLELFDILGNSVALDNYSVPSTGAQEFGLNVHELKNGLYLLKVKSNNIIRTTSVEIMK